MGKELDFVWRGERRNGGWMVVVVVERGEERRISNVSLSVQRFSKLLQHCARRMNLCCDVVVEFFK